MPKQAFAVATVAMLIFLSGCSGLGCSVGIGNCGPSATPTPGPTVSETTQTSTERGATDTQTALSFGADTNTDSFVLPLSDVPNAYNFTSESKGDEKTDQPSIRRYHHRTFTLSDPTQAESLPILVISGVTIYDGVDTAEQGTPGIIEEARAEGMTSEDVQLTSETSVTKIQGTTETDRKVTILTHRADNMVLYLVVASQSDFFPEKATDWFVKMLGNL